MKILAEILSTLEPIEAYGNPDIEITGLALDSRKVRLGNVFVAINGNQVNGHLYIDAAIMSGAIAIICEELPEEMLQHVHYTKVKDSAHALGIISRWYFDDPSSALMLVGVTGTNGKTTTATLLYKMCRLMGIKAGLLSTVCNYINDKEIPTEHTTPDILTINQLLRNMIDDGCRYCFMEVSSHAIVQKRIEGLYFRGAIFTNITHDHLDYHKTFAEYIKAKKTFFDKLPKTAFSLVNIDDRNGRVMVQNTTSEIKTYATKSMADFTCKVVEQHLNGMLLRIHNKEVWTNFIGDFNAYNLLAVYSSSILLGFEQDDVLQCLSKLYPVSGRFEYLQSSKGVTAIVDYAHTPDALQNVLDTIIKIVPRGKQVITVVGAGGNRDKLKRPEMARIAAERSNRLILTSDNPRFEKPEDILADMEKGITENNRNKTLTITDRKEAIKTACMLASEGDIILVAGKGHENYQEVNGVKFHFDDKEVLAEIFNHN